MANTIKKEIIENTHVTTAGALKRSGAFLIDIIIMLVGMYILSLAITPLFSHIYKAEQLTTVLAREQKLSNLVNLSGEILPDESNINDIEITSARTEEVNLASATYKFYTIFLFSEDSKYTPEWYAVNILKIEEELSMFTYEVIEESRFTGEETFDTFTPPGISYKNDETLVTNEKIVLFNKTIYNQAVTLFNNRESVSNYNEYVNVTNSALITISASIFYFALPLLFKNGKTIGKKILKLSVTTKHGYKARELRLLLRFLSFLLFEILSNLFIPIVGLFVSLTIMVFSGKGYTIHDLIAGTRVIDDTNSKIYTTVDEFKAATNDNSLKLTGVASNINEELLEDRLRDGSTA